MPGRVRLGKRGPQGVRGSIWTSGAGAPGEDGAPLDGDFYLDTNADRIFKRVAGAWVLTDSIHGSVWLAGSGAPAVSATDGDFYLDVANGDVYTRSGGVWTEQGNIKGLPGVHAVENDEAVAAYLIDAASMTRAAALQVIAEALANPGITTVISNAVDTYLAGAGPLGNLTLTEGYANFPGGTGNYTKTAATTTVTVGPTVPVTASTDSFFKVAHGLPAGAHIKLTSLTNGAGLVVGTDYFVVNPTANTFQLATTVGGTSVDVTTDGAATVVYYPLHLMGDFDLRIFFATPPTVAGGAFQTIIARRDADTEFSWRFSTGGGQQLLTSTDGTTLVTASGSGGAQSVLGYWVTRRASDGRIQFFTYTPDAVSGYVTTLDGKKWTQSGTDKTGAVGTLAVGTAALSIAGLGAGTNALTGKITHAEIRNGIDGTIVAAPDFRHRNSSVRSFVGDHGNTWTMYGTASLVEDAAAASKTGVDVSLASQGYVDGKIASTGATPTVNAKNPLTGMYHPNQFGDVVTSDETRRAAVQAAINQASADGGGTVWCDGLTVGKNPTLPLALYTMPNVKLKGPGMYAPGLKLGNGANCHLIAGQGTLDDTNRENSTNYFMVEDLKLDGNRTNQGGLRVHHGLYLVRHPYLVLTRVWITECDGNGYHSTGGSILGVGGTRTTRPLLLTDVVLTNNNGWGLYSSATNRQFQGKGIHCERNGSPQAALVSGALVFGAPPTNIVTGGDLVLSIDGAANVTVTLATGDVPATVVSKINTVLGASATASLQAGILKILSATTGGASSVKVVSGTGTVLADLGFTAGQYAGANEFGGAFLDHSEDLINGLVATLNYGDGIYVHNVQMCHYRDFHTTGNDGYGVFVESMVNTEGHGWSAFTNCQSFGSASYRLENTDTAEIYFDNQSGSYGVTQKSRVDGVHATGDMSFGGPAPDNRFAQHSVIIESGVAASFLLTNVEVADGGLAVSNPGVWDRR